MIGGKDDQGVDIVCEKRDGVLKIRIAIQCKCKNLKSKIGPKDVSTLRDNLSTYQCQQGILVTTTELNDAAKAKAKEAEAGHHVRTPSDLVRHMTSVLGYAQTFFEGGRYRAEPLSDLGAEVARFHAMLEALSQHLAAGSELRDFTEDQLLQGPFADAMTHVGQLAVLRRLAGSPIPPENFIEAAVDPANLGPDQPEPVSPNAVWPEGPRSAV